MIYEMSTQSFLPIDLPKYLDHAESVGRPVRGNDYGVNCGYWTSETGRLNQVWQLWRYDSYAQREDLRAKLSQNQDWADSYLNRIKDWVLNPEICIMNPHSDFVPPGGEGNIYEYRYYRVAVGTAGKWISEFKNALPIREKYSKMVGLWQTEAGQPNEVSHLWAYTDLNNPEIERMRLSQDTDWQAFQSRGRSMLLELNNVLLKPTNYSSIK